MSKISARWLAAASAAAIIAPIGSAAADTGTGEFGYTLTTPEQVVIASSGCTSVPYSIGVSSTPPGDQEDGNPVTIQMPGGTYTSPSGWGETGTTPTGATTGTIQVCGAVPGYFQASTSYTASDTHGNILGAFMIWASVIFVAPPATTTTAPPTPTTATTMHKKKCKRVRRHHHWRRVCHR